MKFYFTFSCYLLVRILIGFLPVPRFFPGNFSMSNILHRELYYQRYIPIPRTHQQYTRSSCVVWCLINSYKWFDSDEIYKKQAGPTKELWRSKREVNRGKSRQITANRGKFHSENNGDHFFKRSRWIATDRIAEGLPKNNGDHFGGEI